MQAIDLNDTVPENVPAEVVSEAKAAFRQRQRENENVAVLVWDSLVDEGAPSWHHHLRFEHHALWIEVSVSLRGSSSRLHGVVHSAGPLSVELQSDAADFPVIAEVTRHAFRIDDVPRGLVRLHFVGSVLTSPVSTDWFYA